MRGLQNNLTNLIILSSLLLLNGCIAPVIIGGGAAAGMLATREKGIGGTVSDSNLASKVKANLYNFNPEMHAKVSVIVQNQEVFLTGLVQDPSWPAEAERLAKSVGDVKSVTNHIETEGEETLGSVSSDSWISTRIRSKMLFEPDIYSLNYTIETTNGVVYITGVSQSEAEVNRITEIARNVGGVKKVVNLAKIKESEASSVSDGSSNQKADSISVKDIPPQQ